MLATERKPIRRLEDMGYTVRRGSGPLEQESSWYIKAPTADSDTKVLVVQLEAFEDYALGTINILCLEMSQDTIPKEQKMPSSEILLSFWRFHVNKPVSSLQILYFIKVDERSVCQAVLDVYIQLGPKETPLSSRVDTGGPGSKSEALPILKETEYGRIACHMLSRYQEAPCNDAGHNRFAILPCLRIRKGRRPWFPGKHGTLDTCFCRVPRN